ncbi:MAG: N-acetyltransferase [Anaerolineae bacterium]|nr:N-acetyltransferase [Phycisphaerae bacterium]
MANEPISIRLATTDDAAAINDIYNWYIPRSTCTYQEEPEPIESRQRWLETHQKTPRHPVTVALIAGEVIGWGSLSDYRERSAYRFTCESSVYVRHDMHGRGIGKAIVADLIERAKSLDYRMIIAGADAEQAVSIALHKKFGFVECGRQIKVGYKFDRWLDVVFMQLELR